MVLELMAITSILCGGQEPDHTWNLVLELSLHFVVAL